MKGTAWIAACAALLAAAPAAPAYVEVPYALGRICQESTNIVVVEAVKVNKEKNFIIFKKVEDLKGKHPKDEIKHNIGQRGYHAREWQNVMAWAEAGKKAVFFHNGGASETCTGTYWYQCYAQDDWWGMSHAEPFMLRSYCGDVEKLAAAVKQMLAGKEVVVPCMVDGDKNNLHLRRAKVQRLKASMELQDYNPTRDFVSWGGDGEEVQEFGTVHLIAESTPGWKAPPEAQVKGDAWRKPDYDDGIWRTGEAPAGYGEDELVANVLRRHPRLIWLSRAVLGILAGVVATLGWLVAGLIAVAVMVAVRSGRSTTDPGEVADIAAGLGTFTVPPGLGPLDGENVALAGIRTVRYGRSSRPGPPDTILVLMQFPEPWVSDRDGLENLLRGRGRAWPVEAWCVAGEKQQATCTIRGKPVVVTLRIGTDPQTAEPWREYVAVFPGAHGRTAVLVLSGGAGGLAAEEVRQFFESFR